MPNKRRTRRVPACPLGRRILKLIELKPEGRVSDHLLWLLIMQTLTYSSGIGWVTQGRIRMKYGRVQRQETLRVFAEYLPRARGCPDVSLTHFPRSNHKLDAVVLALQMRK